MSSHIERNPEAELTHEQPLGRVRSWMVPLTIAEVETHFRGVWPGFRFFAGDSTRVPRDSAAYAADSATRLNPFALPAFKVMQQLRVDSGGTMVPLDSVPLAGPGPTDGLLLLASDGPRTDAAPPVAGMRAQTLLIVLNYRRAR